MNKNKIIINKYNHLGRPTIEEKKKYLRKRNLKNIGILSLLLLIFGSIFIYANKDTILLETIMGNSVTNKKMQKVQNNSLYKRFIFVPDAYNNKYYYQTYTTDKKTNYLSYLFNKAGNSDKYSWIIIELYSDGKLIGFAKSTDKSLKISENYVGKTLAIKIYLEKKKNKKEYVKYYRLYVSSGSINNCTYISKDNGFLWPIGPEQNGKPSTVNISSSYSNRKLNGSSGMHYGIDISKGNNPTIIAIYDGKVTKVVNYSANTYNSKKANYGTYVILEHDYNGEKLYSIYAHMKYKSIPKNIYVGAKIKAGTKLGIMGNTGYSSGNHLHFEMRKNDTAVNTREINNVNPLDYINNKKPYPSGKWECD